MATATKFESFVKHLAWGVHDFELTTPVSHTLTVALTAAANAPAAATDEVLANLTQITYTNLSTRVLVTSASAEASGVFKLTITDLTISASGGAANPFRYICIYDDLPSSPVVDPLICYYDYGSDLTLGDGESLTLNFDDANGFFTIT